MEENLNDADFLNECLVKDKSMVYTLVKKFQLKRYFAIYKYIIWGSWVVQLVRRPTLGFSSGRDLRVLGLSPETESRVRLHAQYGVRLSLSLSPCLTLSKVNKSLKK